MSAKFCSSCGAALAPGAAFCASCGAAVQKAAAHEGEAAPTPAADEPPAMPPPLATAGGPTPPPGPAIPPAPPPQPPLPPEPTAEPRRRSILPIVLIGAGVLIVAAAVAIIGGFVSPRDIFGGSTARYTASSLEGFITGTWGRNGSCRNTFTFEPGGRFLVTGEDPGTWTLQTDSAGADILRVEIDGSREQGVAYRSGENLDIIQSQGRNLDGRWQRCAGAGAGGTAAGPTPAIDVAVNTPSGGSQALVGRWSRNEFCTRVMEFRPDGTMSTTDGTAGTWSMSRDSNGNRVLTMQAAGRMVSATVDPHQDGGFRLLPRDGSPSFIIRRC